MHSCKGWSLSNYSWASTHKQALFWKTWWRLEGCTSITAWLSDIKRGVLCRSKVTRTMSSTKTAVELGYLSALLTVSHIVPQTFFTSSPLWHLCKSLLLSYHLFNVQLAGCECQGVLESWCMCQPGTPYYITSLTYSGALLVPARCVIVG